MIAVLSSNAGQGEAPLGWLPSAQAKRGGWLAKAIARMRAVSGVGV